MKGKRWGKKGCWVTGLFALTLLAVPGAALQAQEEKPTGNVTVSALNRYIWRGYEMSRNSVVVQPSITVGYGGFSAGFWGNVDTQPYSATDKPYSGTWNETDFTFSYTKSIGLVNVGAGYIYYSLGAMNPDAEKRNDSQEFFAGLSLKTLLVPTLLIYKEIDHSRNWYFSFGISHSFELSKTVSLNLAATAGYLLSTDEATYPKYDGNASATTQKFSNFHEGTLSASLPIKMTDAITLTPMLSYIFPLSDDARNEMRGLGMMGTALAAERDSAFLVGGLSVAYNF